MKMDMRWMLVAVPLVGCEKSAPPADAPNATSASAPAPVASSAPAPVASSAPAPVASSAPAPVASSAPAPVVSAAPSTFPPLDVACATDADCTTTGQWRDCCGVCEERYSNKTYVARVQAYCAAHPPAKCPPMACSWAMSTPQCRGGRCQAWSK